MHLKNYLIFLRQKIIELFQVILFMLKMSNYL